MDKTNQQQQNNNTLLSSLFNGTSLFNTNNYNNGINNVPFYSQIINVVQANKKND
jgi:hypothetical protein